MRFLFELHPHLIRGYISFFYDMTTFPKREEYHGDETILAQFQTLNELWN
jgi:hypothetical protein